MTEKRGAEEVDAPPAEAPAENKETGERARKRSRFGAPANAVPTAEAPAGLSHSGCLSLAIYQPLERITCPILHARVPQPPPPPPLYGLRGEVSSFTPSHPLIAVSLLRYWLSLGSHCRSQAGSSKAGCPREGKEGLAVTKGAAGQAQKPTGRPALHPPQKKLSPQPLTEQLVLCAAQHSLV